jgi:predicted phosphodiesterase
MNAKKRPTWMTPHAWKMHWQRCRRAKEQGLPEPKVTQPFNEPRVPSTKAKKDQGQHKRLGQRIAEEGSKSTKGDRSLLAERERKYDPKASTEDLLGDLRKVQKANPTRYISRTFYREQGRYSEKTWTARFGTFHEFRREAGLEQHRGAQRLEKNIAIHAARDRYRGFFEVEILPWVGKYERQHLPGMKRILVGSDIHDLHADMFPLSVFITTAQRVQPDIIVLNGDVFEFAEFSRFDTDPRTVNLRAAFEFVRDQVFKPLRQACPNAQIDLIIGNHDARVLRHMADRTPYLAPLMDLMGISLSKLFGLDKFKINLVNKADFSAYLPKENRAEIAKNYKVYFNTLLIGHDPANYGICSVAGHTHKPMYSSSVNELSGSYFQLTTGCLAKIDFDYVAGMNRYSQSFALFHIDPETRECVPEHIVFTQNYTVVGGILYKRQSNQQAG